MLTHLTKYAIPPERPCVLAFTGIPYCLPLANLLISIATAELRLSLASCPILTMSDISSHFNEIAGFKFEQVCAGIVEPIGVGNVCLNGTLTCYKAAEGDGFLLLFQDTFNGEQRRTAITSHRIIKMTKCLAPEGGLGITNITADCDFWMFVTDYYADETKQTVGADIGSPRFVFEMSIEDCDKLYEKIHTNGQGHYFWKA